MNTRRLLLWVFLFLIATTSSAQDATSVWQSLNQPAVDAAKAANVRDLRIHRDRLEITLVEGQLQFLQPAGGIVFGAVFRGRGSVSVAPPDVLERHQLRLYTDQDPMQMEFTEATFSFSDSTFEEIASQVQWATSGDAQLGQLYLERQQAREDVGAELVPRLFSSLLSGDRKRTALFAADLKTREKGWVHVRYDALDPEEITVGRWTNWGGVTRFDTWLSFPAAGRSAAEAHRDPLARDVIAIRKTKIDAQVNANAELSATSLVTFTPRVNGASVLVFQLDANLRVSAVQVPGGAPLTFFQPRDPRDRDQSYGDYVALVLPEPTRTGQEQTLEFRYTGKHIIEKVGAGNYFCQSFGWYPTTGNEFVARSDFEMTFRFPKRYALVATGNKLREATEGDWTVSTWASDVPLSVAGFAFGDYKIQAQKVGEVDVEVYANRQADDLMQSVGRLFNSPLPSRDAQAGVPLGSLSPAALAKTMGNEVGNTLRVFEAYFGPYPYKRIAVTNIPFSYGQGWPTLVYLSAISFLDSTQRQALGIQEHVELTDFFRAHETSHQWWGHLVGWKSYRDQWLSEGFAQFSGNLYVQVVRGEKEFIARLKKDRFELSLGDDKRRRLESLGPIVLGRRLNSSSAPGAYGVVVYNKGGYVLHMLRMMLFDPRNAQDPEQRFKTMMREFTTTFHNKPASTEDFKAIVDKNMTPSMDMDGNHRMDWFFRQYVYGIGIPEYTFRYTVQPTADGKWKLSGTVQQANVPPGWMDVLPLYLQQGNRTVRIGFINIRKVETPFDIILQAKPDKVLLNAYEDILAEVKQ